MYMHKCVHMCSLEMLGLLELQYQACGLSGAEVWLLWQNPSWLQYGENDSLSVEKRWRNKILKIIYGTKSVK